jgi:hypothetical protein
MTCAPMSHDMKWFRPRYSIAEKRSQVFRCVGQVEHSRLNFLRLHRLRLIADTRLQ